MTNICIYIGKTQQNEKGYIFFKEKIYCTKKHIDLKSATHWLFGRHVEQGRWCVVHICNRKEEYVKIKLTIKKRVR